MGHEAQRDVPEMAGSYVVVIRRKFQKPEVVVDLVVCSMGEIQAEKDEQCAAWRGCTQRGRSRSI